MPSVTDAWTLLTRRKRAAPGSPMVTYLSDDGGERTELSVTSLENAAAKIANALRDEFDLDPGAAVGAYLPLHWQRSAWCAGAWTAGCLIAPEADPASVDLIVADPTRAADLAGTATTVAVVSLHPFGLPLGDAVPPGCVDVTLSVRQQPDAYLYEPPQADAAALLLSGTAITQADAWDLARTAATAWGLADGGRLLVDPTAAPLDTWLALLAVPLVMNASVVLVGGSGSLERLASQERVTARVP